MEFKRIKAIREDNDLTQSDVARLLGVNRITYSLWELEINTIPLMNLVDFCNKFYLSLDYILEITNVRNYTLVNKDIDFKILGERLKFIRKKEKKTQVNIATLFNTTHSTWSAYENSKVLIPTVFIWKFATEYKCSVDWLCGRINLKNLLLR